MKKKAFIPISALMGALLLALVAAMNPFVAERNVAQAQSADATLAALAIVGEPGDVTAALARADGSLGDFDGSVEDYTARIPFITGGVTVTATATDADNATVSFSHSDRATNEDGQQIDLSSRAGMTTDIIVTVRAQAGNTKNYTISVYRERETESDNTNLSSLSISPGSLSPRFSASETSYNARVQAGEVTVSYRLSDTAGGASAAITAPASAVNGMVTLGAETSTTTITVQVTAEDGSADNYSIAVYRVRANRAINANLTTLTLAPVPASPSLVNDISLTGEDFSARAANGTTHVTVTATPADLGAVAVISPSDADGNLDDHQVSLTAGAMTTITVKVTAEDTSSTKTYTIKVYRNRSTLSMEARLSSLSLSAGTLDPSFSRDANSYEVRVGHDLGEVTVSCATVDTAGAAAVVVVTDPVQTDTAVNECGEEFTLDAAGEETEITVTVTAEDGNVANPYTIIVYRVRSLPSADATLTTLTLAPVPASPGLVDGIALAAGDFSAEAANDTTHVTVTAVPTADENGATAEISPDDADTSEEGTGHQVALTAGMKTPITITVTAEDGTTTKTYMVDVYRQRLDLSEDATLSALSLSDGMLEPAFRSDRTEYDAKVGSDVSEVTVSHTPTDNMGGVSAEVSATEGDGTTDCDGSATCDVEVMEVTLGGPGSETIISVAVTPENGAAADVETYMITVYRERRNLETINTLTEFRIIDANPSGDTYTDGIAPNGTVDHDNDVNTDARNYWDVLESDDADRDVGYRVRTVIVSANPSDTAGGAVARITAPPDKDPTTAAHEIELMAGAETMITVVVMAEDPAAPPRTYTASVYRQNLSPSDDATLSSLMLSGVVLTPEFASGMMEYEATALHSEEETTITAIATHLGAQSSVIFGTLLGTTFTEGTDADIDMDGWQVSLTAGQEVAIAVEVTPEDGTTTEYYTIKVTRAAELGIDASLSSLTLSDIMLSPDFDPAITEYTATVANVEATTVVATPTHSGATVGGDTGEVSLTVGENTVEVMVTAEDGTTTMTYTVMVTILSSDATLESLNLSDIMLSPDFDSAITEYTAMAVGLETTMVDAMATHSAATVGGDTGEVSLMVGDNPIMVTVTAGDGTTSATYTVTVTIAMPTLLDRYDADDSGDIDLSEVSAAIDDYFNDDLTLAEVSAVIDLYFG